MFSDDPLLRAIKIIGSRQIVIKMLSISGQRLNAWLNGHVTMGFEYAMALEYLTGKKVTASELVPQKAELLKKLKLIY
jgi:DNA-binding transcriptional regulator YdaS (Cro superfamily)